MLKKLFVIFLIKNFLLNAYSVSDFHDLNGIVNFEEPEKISNQLFVLTNPKSGSHLLLYSIIKLTKRPLRGRVPLWHFLHDEPFFKPENIMGYETNFAKPTFYWGHETYLLNKLNRNNNKLIFILRNYQENIISRLIIKYRNLNLQQNIHLIDQIYKKEIFDQDYIFQEYIERLITFDNWNNNSRLLVKFVDLVKNPNIFVPQVISFIEEKIDFSNFINNYNLFKTDLRDKYAKKNNGTGAGDSVIHFKNYLTAKTIDETDNFIKTKYPDLWSKYLNEFTN